MMPTIRVSDGTWERLKSHARPLEDSVDDVVGRALDALDREKKGEVALDAVVEKLKQRREAEKVSAEKLPQKEFRMPLLEVLTDLGGEATTRDIRDNLFTRMRRKLEEGDHELVSSGDPRWWNATCWERNELVKIGALRNDSERGTWAINSDTPASLHRRDQQGRLVHSGKLIDVLKRYRDLPPTRYEKYFIMLDDTEL